MIWCAGAEHRNFLTSSALTLVIDLFFTFVFLLASFAAADRIVLGSSRSAAISVGVTPLFRRRLAPGGAENQAFWSRALPNRDTQAMAVEPRCSAGGKSSSPRLRCF